MAGAGALHQRCLAKPRCMWIVCFAQAPLLPWYAFLECRDDAAESLSAVV